MTFAAQETSRQEGAPIGLLLFTYGPATGQTFAYTDSETAVTYNGITYTPVPIDRDSVKVSGTLDKANLEISAPQDSGLTEFFDVWPPSQVVTIQIYQGHVGNSDFKLAFAGRVLSTMIEGNVGKFVCAPISSSMMRSGLRRKYQYGCPHVLYGTDCGASQSAATITVTPSAVTIAILSLGAGWSGAIDPSKYIGGLATWTTADGRTEYRQIINDPSTTSLLLSGDSSSIPTGGAVALSLGCSHQMGDCGTLHANLPNFGGQPWIPTWNPVGIVNLFH